MVLIFALFAQNRENLYCKNPIEKKIDKINQLQ